MSYVLKIYNAQEQHVGYVHVPRRTKANPKFTTTELEQAQRIAGSDKAHQRAMRYNAMNATRGLHVNVVPYAKEIEDAR